MGLSNFLGQKSRLDEIQHDTDRMKQYIRNVSNCIKAIDACWVGNKDKQRIVDAIVSHLMQVNTATDDLNVFRHTALFTLIKINELGSIAGLRAPGVSPLNFVKIFELVLLRPKIQIDTTALRNVADKIDSERKHLDETSFSITNTKNVLDIVVLNLFGLNGLLSKIDNRVAEQKTKNLKIVNAIKQICDLYDNTENKLREKISTLSSFGTGDTLQNGNNSKTGPKDNGKSNYPVNGALPCQAQFTNVTGERSPATYNTIIDQFDVDANYRYAIKNGNTYCNIFAWDVTSAMGAEIPHWADRITGEPRTYPNIEGAYELNADSGTKWLRDHGSSYGWIKVSIDDAQAAANKGQPTVSTGNGHIQVVRPIKEGDVYNASSGPYVAQAGLINFDYGTVISGMGTLNNIEYYTHL